MQASVEPGQRAEEEAPVVDSDSRELTIGRHRVVIKQLNGFESRRVGRMTDPKWLHELPWNRAYSAVRELDGQRLIFPGSEQALDALSRQFTDAEGDKLMIAYQEAFGVKDDTDLKNS